ncbi:hypothetical protein D3C86_2228220 [compost metagenome]
MALYHLTGQMLPIYTARRKMEGADRVLRQLHPGNAAIRQQLGSPRLFGQMIHGDAAGTDVMALHHGPG